MLRTKGGIYRFLVRKYDLTGTFGRIRRGRNDNIKLDLQVLELGYGLIYLAQDKERWSEFVNAEMNLRVP
jgi:hypothetical protein